MVQRSSRNIPMDMVATSGVDDSLIIILHILYTLLFTFTVFPPTGLAVVYTDFGKGRRNSIRLFVKGLGHPSINDLLGPSSLFS